MEDKIHKGIFISLLFGFLLVLYQISFPKEEFIKEWINLFLRQLPRILMFLYFAKWFINTFLSDKKGFFHKEHAVEFVLFVLLVGFNFFKRHSEVLSTDYFLYLLIITFFFLRFMEVSSEVKASLMNPPVLFAISFLLLIFWGTAMLLIPNATNGKFRFVDAAFTATSSVCVTGLSVVDVSTKFTDMGNKILLALFQIGGLGLMTFTNFFAMLFRGGMSLRNQLMVSNIVELNEPGSLFSVLKKILFYTFFIEIIGSVLIFMFVDGNFQVNSPKSWFFSVFHSVAAFCGAGFSTVPDGLYNATLRFNYPFMWVISALVIFGGIGFPVVNDIYNGVKHFVRGSFRYIFLQERYVYQARILSVHSKIVLTATAALLVFGTAAFYFLEYSNTLAEHLTQGGKLTMSFFGSAVPRSAGFNAVNMGALAQGTILIYLLLMWIGGAPNSTAGGIKVTTFSLAIMSVLSLAKGKERVEVFDREITLSSVQRSYVIIFLSVMIIGIAVFLVSIFDPEIPLQMVAFECFSAYGTVGLSLNLTPMLSDGSKWVLICVMFLGRVGLFTILFGIFSKDRSTDYKYPKESIQVL
jgi:trk system potassium uptake protein TrkH